MLILFAQLVVIGACCVLAWFILRRRRFNATWVVAIVVGMLIVADVLVLLGTGDIRHPVDDLIAFIGLVVATVGISIALRALSPYYGKHQDG